LAIVFLGTSEFAAAILERLAGEPAARPALVITRPDRPSGRGRRLSAPPVADRARALDLELAQPEDVNSADARAMIAAAARAEQGDGEAGGGPARHTVVVCAFGALIKEPLLSDHDMLNVHPSLLPRWRGAAPVERAIMAGDSETGVSIMRLTAGLDSGPVCLTGVEPIAATDTYGTLAARLERLGGELLARALAEAPSFVEQPEHGVSYAEKIVAADRLLDPRAPAAESERRVRALTPHIGARVALPGGDLLGVRSAALVEPSAAPGDTGTGAGLTVRDGRLLLDCTPGALELLEVKPPGARAMDAASYLRGHAALGRL
jgi:methionyl-tRNA formyltransferase